METVAESNLIGYYNFESFNSTHVHDLSGNGEDMQIIGSVTDPSYKWSLGYHGNFSNTSYLEKTGYSHFDGSSFTISFWFMARSNANAYQGLMSYEDPTFFMSMYLEFDSI